MKYFPTLVLLAFVVASATCLEEFESSERDARFFKGFYPFPDPSFFRSGTEGFDSDETNREPLVEPGFDYIEGSFPAANSRPEKQPFAGAGFEDDSLDASGLFQQQFGGFFGGNVFNPFGNFGGGGFGGPIESYKPWYKGPNVCVTREEDIEEDKKPNNEDNTDIQPTSSFHHFSLNVESCQETNTKHICKRITSQGGQKKTITKTSACCHGFKRSREGFCVKFELLSMSKLGEQLNSKHFIESAEKNDLQEMMKSNITIFMPADSVFMEYSGNVADNNLEVQPLRSRRQSSEVTTKDLILSHIVDGFIDIEDVDNEQILTNKYNSTIRLNVFPKIRSNRREDDDEVFRYLYTANCVPIVKANKFAENGIVHKVERVLTPINNNVMEIIRKRDDMTILRTVLEKTKMDKLLDGTSEEDPETKTVISKQFSIFAPTDSAFEKLDPQLKRKLKEGAACAENILKNHIMDLTFCSSAVADVEAKVSAYNLLGEKMIFERSAENEDEKVTNEIRADANGAVILINDKAKIMERDLMGTNGVVHIIDTVLETQSGLPITTMLSSKNLTIFKSLIEYGSFSDDFDNLDNATYFAPSDEAFEASDMGKYWVQQLKETPQKLKNNEKLKEFLNYHVVQPLTKSCELSEKMLPTSMGEPLRVNLYTTMPGFTNVMNRATVNCARLIHFDQDSCGSVLHEVDKVLSPPSASLMEMLQSNAQYSRFLALVEKANLISMLEEASDDGITLFVPRNEVFEEVADWIKAKSDAELEELIKNHISANVMCCAGIVRSEWPFSRTVETISKNQLTMNRDRRPKIQNAGITKCDQIATNGIIHEINDVINVAPRRQPNENHFYNNFFNRPFFFK